jgi:hypothetical protein
VDNGIVIHNTTYVLILLVGDLCSGSLVILRVYQYHEIDVVLSHDPLMSQDKVRLVVGEIGLFGSRQGCERAPVMPTSGGTFCEEDPHSEKNGDVERVGRLYRACMLIFIAIYQDYE